MAQAGLSVSSPPGALPGGATGGFLRVVSPAQLDQFDQDTAARQAANANPKSQPQPDIGSWIRRQWMIFRDHRNLGVNSLNFRLLRAQRMLENKYDPEKISQISAFGGSEVFAGLVATKCRGATALLRDVYLTPSRPWDIRSTADPPIPPDVMASIMQLIAVEVANLRANGQPVEENQVHMRYISLLHSAQQAARRNADMQAGAAGKKIDDILVMGHFYQSLGEFLLDLPVFPFAVLKGPVVRMVPRLSWVGGRATIQNKPTMFWERVNPFNLYWSPGASSIEQADLIERKRYTRSDLNDLIGLPGYDESAVRGALDHYSQGLREWLDAPDPEQAINEGREDPNLNRTGYIDGIEYHGNMQGQLLLEQGINPKLVPDPERDYKVQSWVVGNYTLKTMINPSPRQRHPYFVTSFEKIPGTIVGRALPDILEDCQEVANAGFRAMVNNLGISSGPQVVINDEMVSPTEGGDELYPWKRWHVQGDPLGNQREPITFFQPQSYAQELLMVISAMNTMADERSAIPRYLTGESLSGGAGRTSSGLAMLMNNAEKVLQTVAANVDTDVMQPALEYQYDMMMLTDVTGILTGEEEVRVLGSAATIQRETEKQKRLQALQITANPIDAPIIGQIGRARLLRAVFEDLNLPDDIVPDDQTLQAQLDAQKQLQAAGIALQAQGQAQGEGKPGEQPGANNPPKPGQPGPAGGQPASQAQGNQAPAPTPAGPQDFSPGLNLNAKMGAAA